MVRTFAANMGLLANDHGLQSCITKAGLGEVFIGGDKQFHTNGVMMEL